jgi:regulatory protein
MSARDKAKKLDENGLWNYALRALGRRAHSTGELKQKLALRADSTSALNATLAKLREYGFTDDRKFSETFAAARLENKGFGRSRVVRELRLRRVAPALAEQAVEKAFRGTDEQQLIRQFLERRYRGKDLRDFLAQEKNLAAAYRRLRMAGYSSSHVLSVLRQYSSKAEGWEEAEE